MTYAPDKYIALEGDSQEQHQNWEFDNRHAAQPLRVTIEAKPDLADYGHADNIVLLEPGPLALYTEGAGPLGQPNRQTTGLEFSLDVSATSDRRGQKCFAVTANNAGTTPAGWGCAEVAPQKEMPILKSGRNKVRFNCQRGPNLGGTVNVTIHTRGEPLRAGQK